MSFRLYDLWIGLFTTSLIISMITANKLIQVGDLVFSSANIIFPLSYILSDLVTEVYGFRYSRRMILIGFGTMVVSSLILYLTILLPSSPEWGMDSQYKAILGSAWLIVIASITAYFFGEYANARIMSKLKVKYNGKNLWWRLMSSSVFGQLIDTCIFVTIAFGLTYDFKILIVILISEFMIKLGIELAASPLTCRSIKMVKAYEELDMYDYHESYRPY